MVASFSVAAATLNAQQATPGVIRRSAPPPRPAAVSSAPRAAAPQAYHQAAFTPNLNGPRSLGVSNGVYRPPQNFTSRQFQPNRTLPAYGNWNRPTNTVATRVTPRIGTVTPTDATATAGTRTWNPGTRSGTHTWNSGTRSWNRPVTPTTNVAGGNVNTTNTANDWRTRNPNNYANWQDARRHYDHRWHDRDWWRRHYTTIIFVNNGYYCWDAGWWYPAWGYDPAADYYAYDGPIYGYDGLPPDQVIARVQTTLQQQGYYLGIIDGELGPMTQQALAAWQRDHGLAITTAIDYPTLASLGLA